MNASAGIQSPTKLNGDKEGESKSKGAGNGPVAGRVVRKEDLVITPNGIELKPMAEEAQQIQNKSVAEKPKVPPKPDLQTLNLV